MPQKIKDIHSALTSKGYGPEKPVADNTTAEGKSKNRRIEFKAVK